MQANGYLSFCAVVLSLAIPMLAGPINPPVGPVTSTSKTLTEVEPRTAINATNTPGDANSIFKITLPGSYYLTGNIVGETGKHGIEIATPGVSIDLNGFDLRGVAGSLDGVTNIAVSVERITLRNGTITLWGGAGVQLGTNSLTGVIESVISISNGGAGFAVGNSYTVSRCVSSTNGTVGFSAPTGTIFSQCIARSNGGAGFSVNTGCTMIDCVAYANASIGFAANFPGSAFHRCIAEGNLLGFSVNSQARVTECIARNNTTDGIRGTNGCTILSNTCAGNGVGSGAGIVVTGSDNRVESNTCSTADRGIEVIGSGNIIIKNTCTGNTTNWTIAAGNSFGPIVVAGTNAAAISTNAAVAGNLGSTDPNANFSY